MKIKIAMIVLLICTVALWTKEKKNTSYNTVEKKGIVFSWKINNDMMDVIISAPGRGWVSVGIDPTTKMKDADFKIGYIKKGKVYVQDNFGIGTLSHKSDVSLGGKENITKASGKEIHKRTEISFSIPLDSGDKYDKKLTKGKHVLLLAYSHSDNFTSKHKVRTKVEIEKK